MTIKAVSMAVLALGLLGVAHADQDMDLTLSPTGNCQRISGDLQIGDDGSLTAVSSTATITCPIVSAKPTTTGGNEWMMRDVMVRLAKPSGAGISGCRIHMQTVDRFLVEGPVIHSNTAGAGQTLHFRQDMGHIPIDTSQQNYVHAFYSVQCTLAAGVRMLYYRSRVDDDVIND